jgi:hypothetical protein
MGEANLAKVKEYPEMDAVLGKRRLFGPEMCLETFARLSGCEFQEMIV